MKRGRNTKNQYSVTLFPFLAVLICTMGILVVLLVVAVRAADFDAQKATEESRAKYESEIETVQDSIDDEAFRASGLNDFRPDLVKRLQKTRAQRAHVQLSLDKLDESAKQIALQHEKLNQPPANSEMSLSQLEAEAALLSEQIQHASTQLQTIKDIKPVEVTTYSIVPTDTGASTRRRPIYVECVNDKLILRPYQVTLSVADFQKTISVGNPLDTALIAIRDYWKRYDLAGEQGDPYPLLVVRPSGARAYALARHSMQSWQDEFGYELIEEDLPLEFGEQDTQLQEAINLAIEKAKQREANLVPSDDYAAGSFSGGLTDQGQGSVAGRSRSSGRGGQYAGLTVDSANGGFSMEGNGLQQDDFEPYRDSDQQANSAASPEDDFAPLPNEDEYGSEASNSFGRQQVQNQAGQNQTGQNQTGQNQTGRNGGESTNPNAPTTQASAASAASGAPGGSAFGNSLESIANTRGADWALPSRSAGGTVYRRPITVYCSANELVVKSGTSLNDRREVVTLDGPTQNAVDSLVAEVWEKIDSWGFAGTGGYWKPELKLNVLPGGMQRANDLRMLLRGSGLDIDVIEIK